MTLPSILNADKQAVQLYVAGLEPRPTVFACQVNQTFSTHDMVAQFTYDNAVGTYTNIIPGMTIHVGTAPGAHDVGIARVRKAPTSSIIYVGETSEVDWQNDLYITIIDEILPWQRHVRIVEKAPFMDYDIAYTDQHVACNPVAIMGPDGVLDVSEYPVEVKFPGAEDSWVFGSTISGWAWSSNAGTWDDETTNDPTLTISEYPANGLVRVRLVLTAANSKQSTAYRYFHVYDEEHPPMPLMRMTTSEASDNGGGWSFTLEADVPDEIFEAPNPHCRVIVFARDYYDGVRQSVGPLNTRENIVGCGYLTDYDHSYGAGRGTLKMIVQGLHYFLDRMSGFPPGVETAKHTPLAWTTIPALTVDKAVWHLLYWRSNICVISDVRLTGDGRYASKFESPSQSLWQQIETIATRAIFARARVNRFGQFYLEVDAQLVPEGDRPVGTVMTVNKEVFKDSLSISQRNTPRTAMLYMSGVSVNAFGDGSAHFVLANGHVYKRLGGIATSEKLLLQNQAQARVLGGLLAAAQNNKYSNVQFQLAQNNRFLDIAPYAYVRLICTPEENVAGLDLDVRVLVRSVEYEWNESTATLFTSVIGETEIFPELTTDGDVPDVPEMPDLTVPPPPTIPIPPPVPIYPPPTEVPNNQPRIVANWSSAHGIFLTDKFDKSNGDVIWRGINGGLDETTRNTVGNLIVTPNGTAYIMANGVYESYWTQIYRASQIGGMWQLIFENDEISAIAVNPTKPDEIAVLAAADVATNTRQIFVGGGGSLAAGDTFVSRRTERRGLIYWNDEWWVIAHGTQAVFVDMRWHTFSPTGTYGTTEELVNQGPIGSMGVVSVADHLYVWGGGPGVLPQVVDPAGVSTSITGFQPSDQTGGPHNQRVAFSPTGTHGMAIEAAFGSPPYQTTDGGWSWGSVAGVLSVGSNIVESCGDNFRFILGSGTTIKLTMDQGNTHVEHKHGNLTYIASLMNIIGIRYIQ